MNDFVQRFEDRVKEVETYLDLLDALDKQIQNQGSPQFGLSGSTISVDQQRILYSSVYLQLYNLVEATITGCVEALCKAIVDKGPWHPPDLSDGIRREWIRFIVNTHNNLDASPDTRLELVVKLYEHLIQQLPISDFKIDKRNSGTWDDTEIENVLVRLGLSPNIKKEVYKSVKRKIRNDKGALELIKVLRNDLAHGSLSFVECSANDTLGDIRDIKNRTVDYLREIVTNG